ncbi:MAG: SRPBCC family protein [Ilumatobacteraceae bacterium]
MATFSSQNISVAVVPAARERIWDALRDADVLASLTPLVRSIDVDGDIWTWHLRGISALGVSVTPSFTELMLFDEPREIKYVHQPPNGSGERAGASGVYTLEALDMQSTRLSVDITLCVDLPLPKLARRAVEATMSTMMQRTGEKFAENLYKRLGIDPAAVDIPVSNSAR